MQPVSDYSRPRRRRLLVADWPTMSMLPLLAMLSATSPFYDERRHTPAPSTDELERKARAEVATMEAAKAKRRRKLERLLATPAAKARREAMEREFEAGQPIAVPEIHPEE